MRAIITKRTVVEAERIGEFLGWTDYGKDIPGLALLDKGVYYREKLSRISGKNNLYILLNKEFYVSPAELDPKNVLTIKAQVTVLVMRRSKRGVKIYKIKDYQWVSPKTLRKQVSPKYRRPVGPRTKHL